ncbi:MAG: hypothetical protein HY544_03585 [Candidatus Diapherotrites archaeon]|uniref:Membrane protein 6-pyruvoyl-tetrahydropterin synthase-related domain-containing protein n=1 Tax=Candidatus Iainarchaeum sp. TaxID=3101447 RepID=A0A8T3YQY4_9ARCH|nr:hypothetical protein [Candidatus Diapherotrites archaeon]
MVLAYIAVFLVQPFFLQNNLLNGDTPGIYFSSWYTKEYLFPRITGWDPFFFFGYPENHFYGPLVPYASSLLSLFMPLESAFKLLVAAALLLTPLSFYYFARSFGLSGKDSALAMLAMFSLLFVRPDELVGGNLSSLFESGFVANSVALPVFFFYFGSLKRGAANGLFVLPAVLLSLTLLAHTFSGVAAFIAGVAFAISGWQRQRLVFIARHFSLAFLLSAFWLVPAIAKIGYSDVSTSGTVPFDFLVLTIAVVLAFYLGSRKESGAAEPLAFVALLSGFSFLGKIANVPFHFQRLFMFLVLMAPVIIFFVLRALGRQKALWVPFIAACLLVAVFSPGINPGGVSILKSVQGTDEKIHGRLYIDAPLNAESQFEELQHLIPMQYSANSVKGQQVHSSRNSRYIFYMEQALDGNHSQWGVPLDLNLVSSMGEDARALVPFQMRLFGITHVVSAEKRFEEWEEVQDLFAIYLRDENTGETSLHNYKLYKVGGSPIAEVLKARPEVAEGNWDDAVKGWFMSNAVKDTILVSEPVPGFAGAGGETVDVIEQSSTMERMKFRVNSANPVPVLIKISHFPNWRAYSDGTELRIYRASPYFMLVYAKGEFELRYVNALADTAGYALSAVGIAVVAFILLNRKRPFFGMPA